MNTSVVVTGASGFIGSAIVRKLGCVEGTRVFPVSRTETNSKIIYVEDYCNTLTGDVLVHAAEDPDRSRVNQAGEGYFKESVAVVDELLSKGFGKVIYCSSASVYGDGQDKPFSETSPVKSIDNYVRTKLENERQVLAAGGVVVRLSNVIGPNMSPNNVISDILKQLPLDGPIVIRNERPVRDFIWLDDAVEGLCTLITRGTNDVYNIGSGQGTSVKELVEMALAITGEHHRSIQSITASPKPSYNVLDISKMMHVYGWAPTKNVFQCMKALIKDI